MLTKSFTLDYKWKFFFMLGKLLQFIEQPRNVTSKEGGTANFSCVYNGSGFISWKINGTTYSVNSLPPNHRVVPLTKGVSMIINDIMNQLNGSTYQCILVSTTDLTLLESAVGVLLIGKHFLILDSTCQVQLGHFSPPLHESHTKS